MGRLDYWEAWEITEANRTVHAPYAWFLSPTPHEKILIDYRITVLVPYPACMLLSPTPCEITERLQHHERLPSVYPLPSMVFSPEKVHLFVHGFSP